MHKHTKMKMLIFFKYVFNYSANFVNMHFKMEELYCNLCLTYINQA